MLLVETNRSEKAFTLTKNWVASNPRSADARIELAHTSRTKNSAIATVPPLSCLQQALAINQNDPRAWAALGKLREEAGDPQQALANYQRSLNLNRAQPGLPERGGPTCNVKPGTLPSGLSPNGTRSTVVRPPVARTGDSNNTANTAVLAGQVFNRVVSRCR